MGKRMYRRHEYETVDENGEFKSSYTESSYNVDTGPPFVRLFLEEALSTLYGMPASCSTVLYHLLKHATYANDFDRGPMVVYVNLPFKEDLIKCSDLKSVQSIDNILGKLVKQQVLHRLAHGKYQLNPWIFGKGKWTDINELRMTHVWNSFGHTIEINVKRKKKSAFKMSEKDKKIYEEYLALERVAKKKKITLEELLKELGLPDPPDWWYLFK